MPNALVPAAASGLPAISRRFFAAALPLLGSTVVAAAHTPEPTRHGPDQDIHAAERAYWRTVEARDAHEKTIKTAGPALAKARASGARTLKFTRQDWNFSPSPAAGEWSEGLWVSARSHAWRYIPFPAATTARLEKRLAQVGRALDRRRRRLQQTRDETGWTEATAALAALDVEEKEIASRIVEAKAQTRAGVAAQARVVSHAFMRIGLFSDEGLPGPKAVAKFVAALGGSSAGEPAHRFEGR